MHALTDQLVVKEAWPSRELMAVAEKPTGGAEQQPLKVPCQGSPAVLGDYVNRGKASQRSLSAGFPWQPACWQSHTQAGPWILQLASLPPPSLHEPPRAVNVMMAAGMPGEGRDGPNLP